MYSQLVTREIDQYTAEYLNMNLMYVARETVLKKLMHVVRIWCRDSTTKALVHFRLLLESDLRVSEDTFQYTK